MKKIFLVLIVIMLFLTGCGKKEIKEDLLGIKYDVKGNEAKLDNYETENPVVAMYIKKYGSIVIELYPDVAPNTVNNFISLVKSGFYDENTIHRLVPGFVLQGGDPQGTGMGGCGYTIKGEFSNNGFENNLKHEEKVVSMARSQDNDYAAFGKVIDGWDNILNIVDNEKIADSDSGKLKTNLRIKKALIDLKGQEYAEVEKIKE